MTMDGIRFIRAFSPIISKAAMQTYISALPLMAPDTLLFKIYHTETIAGRSYLKSYSPSGWATLDAPTEWDARLDLKTKFSFSTSSGYLVAHADYRTKRVSFYDSRTGKEVGISLSLKLPAESMHLSPDSEHILIVDDNGTIQTWDIKKGLPVHHRIESGFQYPLIHHSANGNIILVGGLKENKRFGDTFSVWNTATAECVQEFVFDISYWHNIALSPDGMKIAVHERKAGIRFLDIKSGEPVDQPFGAIEGEAVQEQLWFRQVIWSSKGDSLATVSPQYGIRLWAPDRGPSMALQDSNGSDGSLSYLAFSPDDSCIAALYSDSKSRKLFKSKKNR
jgi:WD40 repeat protein